MRVSNNIEAVLGLCRGCGNDGAADGCRMGLSLKNTLGEGVPDVGADSCQMINGIPDVSTYKNKKILHNFLTLS